MEVCFKVPNDFVVSQRLLNASEKEIAQILTVGELVYFNGLKMVQDCEPITKAIENEKIKHLMTMNETLQCQIMRTQKECDERMFMYKQESKDAFNELKREKEYLIGELKLKTEENNKNVLDKIDSLLGGGNTIDNIEKGTYGEEYVSKQIINEYPESEIEDVSGETARGDYMWRMDSNSFRCLVEVKNVAQSKNLNVDKFMRDIHINTSNGEANCGIFVSLKTENIPNKGKFKIEYYNEFPIVYVSGVWKNPIVLSFALRVLKSIFTDKTSSEKPNDNNKLVELVSYLHSNLLKEQSFINEIRKSIEKSQYTLQKAQKNVSESILSIEEILNKYDIVNDTQNQNVVQKVINFKNEHGRWPTSNDLDVSKSELKKYGMKNLIQDAKNKMNSNE